MKKIVCGVVASLIVLSMSGCAETGNPDGLPDKKFTHADPNGTYYEDDKGIVWEGAPPEDLWDTWKLDPENTLD